MNPNCSLQKFKLHNMCKTNGYILSKGVMGLSKVSRKVELQSETCHPSQNSRPCNFCFWGVLCSARYHFAIWSRTKFCFVAPKSKLDELSNGIIGFTDPFPVFQMSDENLLGTFLCGLVYANWFPQCGIDTFGGSYRLFIMATEHLKSSSQINKI